MSKTRQGATRRQFAVAAAAGSLAVATTGTAKDKVSEPSPDESLLALVRARYGEHLDKEQMEAVHHSIRRRLARAEVLKRYPVQNGDDPALVFRADLP